MRSLAFGAILVASLASSALAQTSTPEYLPGPVLNPGKAPGLKVTVLNPSRTRSFQLKFAKGDDVIGGLADFAAKNHITNGHFTGLGALDSAVIGWGDPEKKGLKVVRLNEEMEIASFVGDIGRGRDGKPSVHGHIVVGLLRNGAVYAGHLLQGHVSITLDLRVDAYEPLSAAAAK